jgi:ribosomal protein L16/L10AE
MRYFKKKHLIINIKKQNFINKINIGNYCVCFQENGILNSLQFKALTFFLKKKLKFYSKLYLRINLLFKMTKKSIGVRMGKGKGALDLSYIFIQKGQVFFEFGFKNFFEDILSSQNILINDEDLKYFTNKVKKIIKLASNKLKIKMHLYKNFK